MSATSRRRNGSRVSTRRRCCSREAFWPGPLTLVLPKAPGCAVAELATAGLDTIAIRVPAHPVAREILRAFGGPVVAPSANLSGSCLADHGRACAERSCGPDRSDRRWRRGRGRRRIHHCRMFRGADAAAARRRAARRDRARARPRAGAAAGRCEQRFRAAAGAGHAGVALRAAHAGQARSRQARGRRGIAGVRPATPYRESTPRPA